MGILLSWTLLLIFTRRIKLRPLILDISFYQDNPETQREVSFEAMASTDAVGVIFRIGQGTWTDRKIKEYWKNSEGLGLLRGGYWYYDNSFHPKVQAQKCASIIRENNISFELPLFADFEDERKTLEHHGWKKWFDFMEELKVLLPEFKLGVYTGYHYWQENKPRYLEAFREKYFSQYPLWIAQYHYNTHRESQVYKEPTIPSNWSSWELWQVSDRGNGAYYGVESSRIDVNYFNGTLDSLYAKYGKPEVREEQVEQKRLISKSISVEYPNRRYVFKNG